MKYVSHYSSPIGEITLASDGEYLTGLWFDGQKYDRSTMKNEDYQEMNEEKCEIPVLEESRRWLNLYFQGKDPGPIPAWKVEGSTFKKMVTEIMSRIPYGETVTYGDIAKEVAIRMGKDRMSAQAVGGAVGHNPIAIIIPCHRVMGSNGSLTGYGGGIQRKVFLLENEGINLEERGFYVPTKGTAL